MKVEYINPFADAAFSVIEMMMGVTATKGQISIRPNIFTTQQCNVILGVTGSVVGNVIYGMSLITADKIASHMLGQPIRTFDQLAASAIGELGNMITGQAITYLSEAGFICDTTPPSVVRGTNIQVALPSVPTVVVSICMDLGNIELVIGLREHK